MNPITTVRLQSTSSADQAQVPFTFGHTFVEGHLMPTDGLAAGDLPLQVDVKALHADGSVRHAIISGILPKLKGTDAAKLDLLKAPKQAGSFSMAGLSLPDAKVVLKIGTDTYTALLDGANLSSFTPWLTGPVVVEGFVSVPLKNAQGIEHPLLQVRFGVRYYLGTKQARIELIVENTKTFTAAQKLNYDVDLSLAGKPVFSRAALEHYHHSRWHQYAWTGTAPAINVQLDPAYLVSTRSVPNYDMQWAPGEGELQNLYNSIGGTGPMTIGPVTPYMPTTGGRADIGSLPMWSVMWLLSQDKRAFDVMMAAADGAGSWSTHYRDESTDYPVRTDNDKNKDITLHFNLRERGPLPVPRFADDNLQHSWSPFTEDTAHQPSLVYLPYLVTGEYYYLEELHFWNAYNPLMTDPANHGHGKGLVRWLQLRGQAWSMRTLGHAAYITPDDHPMKAYFIKQMDNNLDFYTDTYVAKNPNKLGAYDGSGEGAFNDADHFASWQDDFFTWAIGYLGDLGFTKAQALSKWKSKYSVARMTSADFPWWLASTYALHIRDSRQSPLYGTMGEIYRATYSGDTIPNDDAQPKSALLNGKRFIDMPFYSREQADVLGNANGYFWDLGRMAGYADASMGYPANLQPAIATAVNYGLADADKAWAIFNSRAAKPNYRSAPQWAILPWTVKQVVVATPTEAAPIPQAPQTINLTVGQKPAEGVAGEWIKVGDENGRIKVENGSYVRYGVPGKAYRYAQVKGEFTATNDAFGGDPVPQVVKVVEAFKVSPPKQPGKLKLGSNKKLAKLDVTITVFDPFALKEVKVLSQTMNSSGSATLSDSTFTIGQMYGVRVADKKGNLLDTKLPILKAVK